MLCLTVCSLVTILTLCVHRRSAPSPASPRARPSAPALPAGARVPGQGHPCPGPAPARSTGRAPLPDPPTDTPSPPPSREAAFENSPHLCLSSPLQICNIFESFPSRTPPQPPTTTPRPRIPSPGVTIINSAQKSEVVTRKTFQR